MKCCWCSAFGGRQPDSRGVRRGYAQFSLHAEIKEFFHASGLIGSGGKRARGTFPRGRTFQWAGFNIESLNVAPTLDPSVSHMTIATYGDAQIIEQIIKQLRKLVSVIKVVEFADSAVVEREMVVFRVNAEESKRSEILRIVDIFRCKVVDVSLNEFTIEATGSHDKLEAILTLLTRFGIKEIARTGTVAMRRALQNVD